MNKLFEDSRAQLISKGKSGASYAPQNQHLGKNRYQRRIHSRVAPSVKQYNEIDMDKFFKKDILDVNIEIRGETDNYFVKIKFGDVLKFIQKEVEKANKLDLRCVTRALVSSFNSDNVYIFCSCLHPNTTIKLLDGTCPTVEELYRRFLSGESLYAYSTNDVGDFVPGKIEKVFITKTATDFIEVTLDNNEVIYTTPDHLYRLRDGSYMCAENLTVGQSLMPLYFNYKNGYELVKLNSEVRGWRSVYKIVAEYYKQEEIELAKARVKSDDNMKYDVAIHHCDFNKLNNIPENLEIMTAREHWDYHNSLSFPNKPESIQENIRRISSENARRRNANPTPAMIESRKKWQERGRLRNYDGDRKQQQACVMRDAIHNYWENMSAHEYDKAIETRRRVTTQAWKSGSFDTDKFRKACEERAKTLHSPEMEAKSKEGVQTYWNSLTPLEKAEKCKKRNLVKVLSIINKVIASGKDLTFESYEELRPKSAPKLSTYFKTVEEVVSFYGLDDQYNHKITSVRKVVLDETPVYDIKMEGYPNFLLGAGVIVHNCPDFKYRFGHYALVKDLSSVDDQYWNNQGASLVVTQSAKITNPRDDKGPGCKHIMLVLSNTTWLIKVASVVYNYINYMEKHYERLYQQFIYPAVYGHEIPDDTEVQLDIFDDTLTTDKDTIDISNKYARTKNQFQKDNEYRFQKEPTEKQFAFDELISDSEN